MNDHDIAEILSIDFLKRSEISDVSNFMAELNRLPEHHIVYLGTSQNEVVHYLVEEKTIPAEGSYMLARSFDKLVGVIGVEYDLELKRAWIEGPLVSHPDWEAAACILYESLIPVIPGAVDDYELAGDVLNQNLEKFASANGYNHDSESAVLVFQRSNIGDIPTAQENELPAELSGQLQILHDEIFPGTYYSGKQLVEMQDGTHKIFTVSENNLLTGYVFVYVSPSIGDAFIDFIGVRQDDRGKGTGKRLLLTALHWIFSFPAVNQVGLTVRTENTAGLKLYLGCGFTNERTVRGYRKKLSVS